jgi:hypothetical protein
MLSRQAAGFLIADYGDLRASNTGERALPEAPLRPAVMAAGDLPRWPVS